MSHNRETERQARETTRIKLVGGYSTFSAANVECQYSQRLVGGQACMQQPTKSQ